MRQFRARPPQRRRHQQRRVGYQRQKSRRRSDHPVRCGPDRRGRTGEQRRSPKHFPDQRCHRVAQRDAGNERDHRRFRTSEHRPDPQPRLLRHRGFTEQRRKSLRAHQTRREPGFPDECCHRRRARRYRCAGRHVEPARQHHLPRKLRQQPFRSRRRHAVLLRHRSRVEQKIRALRRWRESESVQL